MDSGASEGNAGVAAGGRLCRPGGQAGSSVAQREGGGSWGNHGSPNVMRVCLSELR
jgi:hypothetical protein